MATSRDRIIEAALSLVAEQGLTEVTMVDIARTAGVARQTLYNHYRDIPSIIVEAATRHNDVAIAELDRALAVVDTPSDRIRQLIRHIAAISTHPGHTLDSYQGLPSEVRDHLAGFDHALEGHIRIALLEGIERGEFRADLSIEADVVLVHHLLRGLSSLVAADPAEAPRIVADATRTTLAALEQPQRP